MSVRPWRAEIRFYRTGWMRPGNSGARNLGSRRAFSGFFQFSIWEKLSSVSERFPTGFQFTSSYFFSKIGAVSKAVLFQNAVLRKFCNACFKKQEYGIRSIRTKRARSSYIASSPPFQCKQHAGKHLQSMHDSWKYRGLAETVEQKLLSQQTPWRTEEELQPTSYRCVFSHRLH